jgi:hypothetical protein
LCDIFIGIVWLHFGSDRIETDENGARYQCQAVCMPGCTTKLPWWNFKQYVMDFTSRNATLKDLLQGFVFATYWHATQSYRYRFGVGAPGRWLYDRFQSLRGGTPFPFRRGLIPLGQPTPVSALDLRPGELVRVKSHQEILATLNAKNRNNGMGFDVEMVPYCGGIYRVKSRVHTFIDEKTGRRRYMKTPAVILEDVWCRSCFSRHRMGCPRSIYSWWREVWLERIEEDSVLDTRQSPPATARRVDRKQPETIAGEANAQTQSEKDHQFALPKS